jgi:hypothetical protein
VYLQTITTMLNAFFSQLVPRMSKNGNVDHYVLEERTEPAVSKFERRKRNRLEVVQEPLEYMTANSLQVRVAFFNYFIFKGECVF